MIFSKAVNGRRQGGGGEGEMDAINPGEFYGGKSVDIDCRHLLSSNRDRTEVRDGLIISSNSEGNVGLCYRQTEVQNRLILSFNR